MDPYPIRLTTCARIPTAEGVFQLCHYQDAKDDKEHLALVMGDVQDATGVLVRVHSECFTGDVLGSQRCDCGEQLHRAMHIIAEAGRGVILYLRQEGRGIGLANKLRAYNLQDQGYDTVDANLMLGHQADEREYSAAAAMLRSMGVRSVRLMTNNPAKIDHLTDLGVVIEGRVPLQSTVTADNAAYLATKVRRMHHLLSLPNGNHAEEEFLASEEVSQSSLFEGKLADLSRRADHHFALTGRPFITVTYAQSLDGVIGSATGGPLMLSGPASLRMTHTLRAHHDAIMVGIGTVLADDPRLTVRLVDGPSPQPIVVDSHGRMPQDANLWQHPKLPWIASILEQRQAESFTQRGATIISVGADAHGHVDLESLFQELGKRGIRSIMVEGGATLLSAILAAGLAQLAVVTVSPRWIGGRRIDLPLHTGEILLHNVEHIPFGRDIVLWGDLAPAVHPTPLTLHQPAAHAGSL